MTKCTSEEIKNRLSNIGEAIGSIALEYIVELEKENKQLKQHNKQLQKNICTVHKNNEKLKSINKKLRCCKNCKKI